MIKMPKALLAAWLADLRSDPPQGQCALHSFSGYCCLGRLQIAAGDAYVELGTDGHPSLVPSVEWLEGHDVDFGPYSEGNIIKAQNPDVTIPEEIAERLDLGTAERSLAGLNDAGVSFKDIADIIEANAEGV